MSRIWTADRLDGTWQPTPGAKMNMFAGAENVKFNGRIWSEGVSHGELIRDGVDQTLSIDPCQPLRFLYQGLDMAKNKKYEYIELPYRLGVITATARPTPSASCASNERPRGRRCPAHCYIRADVMRGLDADSMRGAGSCDEP